MELASFRDQFPVLDRVTWLFTPSCAPAARSVARALREEVESWESEAVAWSQRDETAQRTRGQVARLLGVDPAHVALMQSVAEAAGTVAASLQAGSRVVVGAEEYRSNLFPWLAARERGVDVHQVPMPHGRLSSEALAAAITEGTTLVAVSDVQSATGWRTDLSAVATRCRQVGARLFVDATQSAGVLSLPDGAAPDYIAVHGYKWLLCPRGAAWLYVRPGRLEELAPLAPNPKSTSHPWRDYYGGPLSYAPDARRLDMSLCWPSWAGAAPALDLIGSLDREELEQHCLRLAQQVRNGAGERGFPCSPSELPSHIVTLHIPDAEHAVRSLRAHGVLATARAGVVRLGFHGFNNTDDVSRVLSALESLSGATA